MLKGKRDCYCVKAVGHLLSSCLYSSRQRELSVCYLWWKKFVDMNIYRPRTYGKILFSKVCVCQQEGGGYPLASGSHVLSRAPSLCLQVPFQMKGYPLVLSKVLSQVLPGVIKEGYYHSQILGQGYPLQSGAGQGYPQTGTGQGYPHPLEKEQDRGNPSPHLPHHTFPFPLLLSLFHFPSPSSCPQTTTPPPHGYAMGGMPLMVTWEDFLVYDRFVFFNNSSALSVQH